MKEHISPGNNPESRAAGRFPQQNPVTAPRQPNPAERRVGHSESGTDAAGQRITRTPSRSAWEATRIRKARATGLRVEPTVVMGPPEAPFRIVPGHEGRFTFEPVMHDAEVAREKFIEATGDYLATVFGDRLFLAATKSWETESDPVTAAIEGLEEVSGWLHSAVNAPLKGLDITLGLSPGEAVVTAGISGNLILAPITGPLDTAESYVGIGGISSDC
jgi:hypothetical protein